MIAHITLILAHNQHVFMSILQNIFQSCAGICVLAKVDTAEALVEKINELHPDVVVVGTDLNGMSDAPAWEELITGCGNTKMVLSWYRRDVETIRKLMRSLHAGYVAWDASPAEYLFAVKEAVKGKESYCSQSQKLRNSPNDVAAFAKELDDTRLRMLYCIWMGYSNKEIAMATQLKESTVKSYRKKLKSDTGFRSVGTLEGMVFKQG